MFGNRIKSKMMVPAKKLYRPMTVLLYDLAPHILPKQGCPEALEPGWRK